MSYKNMWKCVWSTMLLFCLISCDDEVVYLPEDDSCIASFGTELSQARQGRPFGIGCQLRLSEHATDVVAEWSADSSEAMPEDSREGQISYKGFLWDEYGKKEVTCKVSYTYGGEAKTLVYSQSFDVIPPLYKNVFLEDNMETVKRLYPEAIESGAGRLVNKVSETEFDEFHFWDGQLDEACNVRSVASIENFYTYIVDALNNSVSENTTAKAISLRPRYADEMTDEIYDEVLRVGQKLNSGSELTEEEATWLNDIYKKEMVEAKIGISYDYEVIKYVKTIKVACGEGQNIQETTFYGGY